MSQAATVFLPWVRRGLAARIATPDPIAGALPSHTGLDVVLALNGGTLPPVRVRLQGPGEVVGIDPRQVVRTEPPAGTDDFEANDLAAIDFDSPDLPWLFTPAAANAQGQLRPWLCLVVVRRQEGVRLRAPRDEPLPVLEIAPPARPAEELPDLSEAWAWAHAQLSVSAAGEGATAQDRQQRQEALRSALATRPELSVSRLLSPRLLAPFTEYLACVVPAFEAGRLAGLGEPPPQDAPLAPAWRSGALAPARVVLPVYHQWTFRTGAREDFESMVARLVPRDLSKQVGRRPMDIGRPGFPVANDLAPTLLLEGALQPVRAARQRWPDDDVGNAWQRQLLAILRATGDRAGPAANTLPVLGPPVYGRWYAQQDPSALQAGDDWLAQVNLDSRERVAAALGTRVVQQQQEALRAQAWEQAGALAAVNQRLRQMQLSLAMTTRLHARHVMRMTDDDALWRLASPAQARAVLAPRTGGSPPLTMHALLEGSSTPVALTSAPVRRLVRPRGAIARRAATALRSGGVTAFATAPGAPTPGAHFFRLFGGGAGQMILHLPPTRGMVSFDALTQRLAPAHAGITYAAASASAVSRTPPRPDFVLAPRTRPVVGGHLGGVLDGRLVHGGLLHPVRSAAEPAEGPPRAEAAPPQAEPDSAEPPAAPQPSARERQGPGRGDPREPREPPEVDPRPPRPPRPPIAPRIDSNDAKAFRAAAQRHQALVNPPPRLVLPPRKRVLLAAAAQRPAVVAMLDPAPALHRRMATLVRLRGEDAAGRGSAPAVGPLGATPVFPQPMSEPLAALSQDWLLPGLERVPPETVALLEPNPRFIEAFMLGLNVEMGRELLWHDFPLADPRATFFQRFWRAVQGRPGGDIAAIADWGTAPLGSHSAGEAGQIVLLLRSGLFRRYPNALVYAAPAVREGSLRQPGPPERELHPVFRGALQPDVSFFGFTLDRDQALADPGWYFVVQQQPTEPRFGFDVEIDFGAASHVGLAAPPAGHELPGGTVWGRNAAHMARITRHQPVRVAIHASELLPPG